METSVEYRLLTEADANSAYMLEKENFSEPWSENSFKETFALSYAVYVGAFAGDELVGMAGLRIIGDEADISNVSVKKEYRRNGIAYKLLGYLFDVAGQKGVSIFNLEVRAKNDAAKQLYEDAGFKALGVRPKFYENPVEDAVIMQKSLKTGKEDING